MPFYCVADSISANTVLSDSMADSGVPATEEAVLSDPTLEQAAAPTMATAAIPATAAVFRRAVIIS